MASFRFRGNIRAVTTKLKRRLTTVLCADVHGYSRLMEADESGTLAALRRCRAAIAMLVARHEGRIVNTWGDAVIAEFASSVAGASAAASPVQPRGVVTVRRNVILDESALSRLMSSEALPRVHDPNQRSGPP